MATDVNWAISYYSNALGREFDKNDSQAFGNGSLSWTNPDEHARATLNFRSLLDTQRAVSGTYNPVVARRRGPAARRCTCPELRSVVCRATKRDVFQVVITAHHDRYPENHVHIVIVPSTSCSCVR